MPDHLEAAGDIVEDFGDVLAHFTQGPAAHAACAVRFVYDLPARQRLGQLRRRFFAGACSGAGSSAMAGAVSAAASASASAVSSSSSLSSSCSNSRRIAPTKRRSSALQTSDLDFQLLDLKRFVRRPALAAASSAPVLSISAA